MTSLTGLSGTLTYPDGTMIGFSHWSIDAKQVFARIEWSGSFFLKAYVGPLPDLLSTAEAVFVGTNERGDIRHHGRIVMTRASLPPSESISLFRGIGELTQDAKET